MIFWSKFYYFRWRKCIWKCRLCNGGHFVTAWMYWINTAGYHVSALTLTFFISMDMCIIPVGQQPSYKDLKQTFVHITATSHAQRSSIVVCQPKWLNRYRAVRIELGYVFLDAFCVCLQQFEYLLGLTRNRRWINNRNKYHKLWDWRLLRSHDSPRRWVKRFSAVPL